MLISFQSEKNGVYRIYRMQREGLLIGGRITEERRYRMKTNKSTLSQVKGMPNAPEAEQAINGSLLGFGGDKVFDAISSDLSTDMFLISECNIV